MANTGIMPAVDLVAPRYGLLKGATVIKHTEGDQTWGAGFEQENSLCGIKGETWVWCGAGVTSPEDPETSSSTELTGDEGESESRWEQVYPFLVQAEDVCTTPLSATRQESKDRLLDVLDYLSVKGAERELWVGGTSDDAKALTRDGTSVGTDLSPKVALATVEDAMAECMPGVQGTIHMTPGTAVFLEGSLDEHDGSLYTLAGSLVLVGAGYAGQTGAPIYGTGPVIAHLGPVSMITDELAQMANVRHNEFHLRAERLVAVTFDGCCHVGATVTYS